MEVKIGVQFGARELVVETDRTPEEIASELDETLTKGGVFALTDTKGRQILVPVDKLAYLEIDQGAERAVGFGRL